MQRLVWACVLGGVLACGSTDPIGSDPTGERRDEDDGEPLVKPDGGRDSGSSNRDGGARDSGQPTTPDSGFAECADTRADAEKKPGAVNVVWVIDSSGSMGQEAEAVQNNLNDFAGQIVGAGLRDYRVVVVSERSFVNVPDPLGSDDVHFLHVEQRVGSDEPLQALLERFSSYQAFLLPDAVTHFIAVTDDESELAAADFVAQMDTNLPADFRVHAIASPPGESVLGLIGGCMGPYGNASRPGAEYWEAAKLSAGLTFSICADNWTGLFDELAKAVGESAAVPCALELPTAPQGQVLNYNLVNIVLSDKAVPRVADEAACGSKAGWFYDDPNSPTGIRLCATSCEAAESGGSLQLSIGCTTIIQ
ncbi:MAG TPA: hypothetical protein VFX59_00980 [Polyangiales bacterium]|nr:hypothetical protein [Polyangiales bacterium]